MSTKLEITRDTLNKIHRHAEADYPNECCGFFFGIENENRQIQLVWEVENSKEGDQRRRFQVDPKDYQKAEKYADDHGLTLLGVYHSHPDHPAKPSEHDREVAMPWFSYIIISVQDGEVVDTTSWQLNKERQFDEEKIEITEYPTQKSKTRV